jgi:hypothetical protein
MSDASQRAARNAGALALTSQLNAKADVSQCGREDAELAGVVSRV